MKKPWFHIAAILTMLFWGMSFIWSKLVLQTYSPVTTIFFRLIISVVALFLFVLVTGQWEKIRKKDIGKLILSALFNPFLYFIGENFGLQQVSASLTAVIISTIPVLTPFFVFLFFSEKITRLNIAGLILSFIGVVIIIVSDNNDLSGNIQGIALLFLAVISAIFYTIFVKNSAKHTSQQPLFYGKTCWESSCFFLCFCTST